MNRIKYLFLAFLSISACQGDLPHEAPFDAEAPLLKQQRATVSGSVKLKNETDHSQVSVHLIGPAAYDTTTLEDGSFVVTGVVPGSYRLVYELRTFESRELSVVIDIGENRVLESVVLAPKQGLLAGKATAKVLSGTSLVATGGVFVNALRVRSARALQSAPAFRPMAEETTAPVVESTVVSSGDGDYSLDLPAGEYQLTYFKDGVGELDGGTYTVTGEGPAVEAEPVELLPLTGFFKIAGTALDGASYAYTQTGAVTLEVYGWSAVSTEIGISADGTADTCAGFAAAPFDPLYPYTLTTEGLNTLCIIFVGQGGRKSLPVVSSILYDKTAPVQPAVRANAGAAYTRTSLVTLELSAYDAASGLAAMQVSDTPVFSTSEAFAPTKVFPLVGGEGAYTFFARFADRAGNWSQPVSASVVYDQTPPAPGSPTAVTINDGGLYARERTVTLYLNVSGADEMQISESLGFAGSLWLPVTSAVNFTLSSADGLKTLYVRYRDAAGNLSDIVSAQVLLDTRPPQQPFVRIGDGSGYSNASLATLTLSASEGPVYYRATTDGVLDNKPWKAYVTSASIDLGTTPGQRTVMVQFQDAAGNVSQVATAQTLLDRSAPGATTLRINDGALYTNDDQGVVTLTLGAVDTGSGLSTLQIAGAVTALATAPIVPFEPTKVFTLPFKDVEGWKELYARYYDKAGNYSDPVSAFIKLDRTAPVPALALPFGNLARTNMLPVTIAAESDAALMLLSNDVGFAGAAWQPYQKNLVWTFLPGQGIRWMYVKLRDFAGNTSDSYSIAVTLDSLPPAIGSVAGLTLNDTLTWDHYGNDVTGYLVRLYNQGALVSQSFTTQTSKKVGAVSPGYSVVALYADGTSSNTSYPPGFYVPQTSALISSSLSPSLHAVLQRFADQYGIGTVTNQPCAAQVHVAQEGTWEWNDGPCGLGSTIYFKDPYPWGETPPPFTAALDPAAGNPLAGLTIDVSGAPLGWNRRGGSYVASTPGPLQWPGTQNPQVWGASALAVASAYDPLTRSGGNYFEFTVPFDAVARQDDANFEVVPVVNLVGGDGPLAAGTYNLPATAQIAGVWAADATIRQDWRVHVTFNNLWDGAYNYYGSLPGTIELPWMWQGAVAGNAITLSDTYNTCYWDWRTGTYECGWFGQRFTVDTAAGAVTYATKSMWWYWQDQFTVFGADGNRVYRLPIVPNSTGTLTWKTESDRPSFAPVLKRMVQKLAAPVRVRGSGNPQLTSNVDGAVAMQISYSGDFTDGTWQGYATVVTLPEGVTQAWVKYRDPAGNETAPQSVAIQAPTQAPRIDAVSIAGANAQPGFSITPLVTATITGSIPPGSRVRFAATDDFADDGWQTLDQNGGIQMTLPTQPGRYTYWFWVADPSNNFSVPVQASVLYDGTPPQAEFSVQAASPRYIKIQGRWTISTSPYTPSLDSLTSQDPFGYTILGFPFPIYGGASDYISYDSAACLLVAGMHRICPFALPEGRPFTVEYAGTDSKGLFVFRSQDQYGAPVTGAVELHSSGLVRISYWNTGARVGLRSGIGDVYSPYSDWSFAQADGSVEYLPNKTQTRWVIQSDQGTQITYEPEPCVDFWWCEVWKWYPVDDAGWTTYTGVAYSAGGAAGRVTARKVYVDTQDFILPADREAVPISDGRYWTTWSPGGGSDSRNFTVNGRNASTSGIVAGTDNGIQLGVPNLFSTQVWPQSNLRLRQTAAVSSAGAPVKADFINGLLYGADGSYWDLTVPHRPMSVRSYGGAWPYEGSSAARWRKTLWAQNGRWDISQPEFPVYLGAAGAGGHVNATFRGRAYQVSGGVLNVYNAETGGIITTVNPGITLTGPMLQRGRYLWVGAGSQTVLFLLTNPDAPTFSTGGTGQYTTFEAGLQTWFSLPTAGLGPYTFSAGYGYLTPSLAGSQGEQLPANAASLEAQGAWVYAPGSGQMLVAQVPHSLPGAIDEHVMAAQYVTADGHFVYTCANGSLSWHEFDWTPRGSTAANCDTLRAEFPYLYVGTQRFVYMNGFFQAAPLKGFELNTPPNLPSPSGTGYVYERHWMPRAGAAVDSERDCQTMLSDQSLVYCAAWDTTDWTFKIYAASTDYLTYSGSVSAQVALPFRPYITDGSSLIDARDGFLVTTSGVWRAYSLNKVENIGYYPDLSLIGGGLATDTQGGLYRLYDERVLKVAQFPNMQKVNMTTDGQIFGLSADGSRVLSTRWGPAAPQLRYVVQQAPDATGLVAAGGYVYIAGTSGAFVRVGPVVHMADFNGQRGMIERNGDIWTLRNEALDPLTYTTSSPAQDLGTLCGSIVLNPPMSNAYGSAMCTPAQAGLTAGRLFEGDLGKRWLGVQSVDVFNDSGFGYDVRTVVADESNRVYASVNQGGNNYLDTYDPGDSLFSWSAASQYIALGFGNVKQGVVDQGMIVVAIDNDVRAYDSKDHMLVWTQPQPGIIRLAAGAGFTAYGDGTTIWVRDTLTGAAIATCAMPHTDFTVTGRRWGGALHPVAYVTGGVNGDVLKVVSLQDCSVFYTTTPNPGVSIKGISVYSNMLLLGYGADGLWLVNVESFPKTGAITQLRGRYGATRGVIVGGFVYTVGGVGTYPQIFQLQ